MEAEARERNMARFTELAAERHLLLEFLSRHDLSTEALLNKFIQRSTNLHKKMVEFSKVVTGHVPGDVVHVSPAFTAREDRSRFVVGQNVMLREDGRYGEITAMDADHLSVKVQRETLKFPRDTEEVLPAPPVRSLVQSPSPPPPPGAE